MRCRQRDALVAAYFNAQAAQAKVVTAVMSKRMPEKLCATRLNSARLSVLAGKAKLEAHCVEHGCDVHTV